jgi:hypothetical protein
MHIFSRTQATRSREPRDELADFEARVGPGYDGVMTIWVGHDGALHDDEGDGAAAPVAGGHYVGEDDLGSAFGSIASSLGSAFGGSGGGAGGSAGGGAGGSGVDFGSLFKGVSSTVSQAASGDTDAGSAVADIFGQVAKAAAPIVSKAASQAITQQGQQQAAQKQAAQPPVAPSGQARTPASKPGPRPTGTRDPKARLKILLGHLAKQYGLPPLATSSRGSSGGGTATGWGGAVRGVWTDLAKNLGIASGSDLSVKEAQTYLNAVNNQKPPARGGKGLDEDGILGPKTAAAIRKFQAGNGLPATGVVDDETGAALSYFVAAVSKSPALRKQVTLAPGALPPNVYYTPTPMPNAPVQRGVAVLPPPQPKQLLSAVDIGQGWVMYGSCACKWDDAACAARCGGALPSAPPPSLGQTASAGEFFTGLQSTSMYNPQNHYTDVYGAWVLPLGSWEDSYGDPWQKAWW